METASSNQQLQLPIITPLPPPKGAVYWTVFFLYPVGFFLDLFPGYRVSNSTVGLGSFFVQSCFRGIGFQLALLPGYKVSNSTVWLGRAPAAKLPLAACASLWKVYPLAAWQGYLGTSVGFLFDLFGCQGCLGGGFAKGRDRAVWVPV